MSYYQDELEGLIDENGEWDCEGYIEAHEANKKETKEDKKGNNNAKT